MIWIYRDFRNLQKKLLKKSEFSRIYHLILARYCHFFLLSQLKKQYSDIIQCPNPPYSKQTLMLKIHWSYSNLGPSLPKADFSDNFSPL